ncbi:MAG: UDP-glucose 4-epimerase [Candidatus Altiarchaeales archaeon]|nr:MAG: UDP-glucose 4-epimerase [Candidatus Altiarchaeales archaeon]
MSKVAVTGGAGFIGSHIVDLLIEKNYDVVVIDDLSTGKRENINDNAKFYEIDICDPYLRGILEREGPDYVIHQAAQVSVRYSLSDPGFDAHTNIVGSLSLLESCRSLCVEKVIYASSGGAIYGEPQYLPVDEKHPVMPLSPYGVSKYTVENYLYAYEKNFDLNYVSLRYSNVYGPRQDPSGEAGVIAIFINAFLNNKNPTINGDGKQTRDFVFVEDIAKANLLALEKDTDSRVFNIGTGVETSVEELYNRLKKLLDSKLSPIYGEAIRGEVRKICLDSALARKELGWTPENTLDDGLEKTIEWFKSNKE